MRTRRLQFQVHDKIYLQVTSTISNSIPMSTAVHSLKIIQVQHYDSITLVNITQRFHSVSQSSFQSDILLYGITTRSWIRQIEAIEPKVKGLESLMLKVSKTFNQRQYLSREKTILEPILVSNLHGAKLRNLRLPFQLKVTSIGKVTGCQQQLTGEKKNVVVLLTLALGFFCQGDLPLFLYGECFKAF